MLKTSPENPTPQVGQLLYCEEQTDDGQFQHASLKFVDEQPVAGQPWNYTELAMMEDIGEGLQVYSSMTAGSMPAAYTRLATDEDIAKFVDLYKQGKTQDPDQNLQDWLEMVQNDSVLVDEEKQRVARLAQ